jgi:uncharacterized paraquat-inducible protein A
MSDPFLTQATDTLAIAVLRAIDGGLIRTRTPVADALENWAANRFQVSDGSGIAKLRTLADPVPQDQCFRCQIPVAKAEPVCPRCRFPVRAPTDVSHG